VNVFSFCIFKIKSFQPKAKISYLNEVKSHVLLNRYLVVNVVFIVSSMVMLC